MIRETHYTIVLPLQEDGAIHLGMMSSNAVQASGGGKPSGAILICDGGPRAILHRTPDRKRDKAIVLDDIPPQYRRPLREAAHIIVDELKSGGEPSAGPQRDYSYRATVEAVDKIMIPEAEIADAGVAIIQNLAKPFEHTMGKHHATMGRRMIEQALKSARQPAEEHKAPVGGIFAETQALADGGDAEAQCRLAVMYDKGEGVPQDFAKAAHWYQKAADQRYAMAQNALGNMYDNGDGVPQDNAQAVCWYQKAADQGYAAAQYGLASMYDQGHGVPQDLAKAVYWYQKAADQGHALAQYGLADMYYMGRGVPRDLAKAADWYQKAAEQGNSGAQYNLGLMFFKGDGVERDPDFALYWYQKAADQGHVKAQRNLGVMYDDAKDYAQAVHWYQKAADGGDASAQFYLGVYYAYGTGVPKDLAKASFWFQKVVDQGTNEATKALIKLCPGVVVNM
ncbi:hypothetical protein FACS1894186_6070 [Alphaproteobacteria bacterium]|nr:hypothetical protein FACS1894186_6070 [Alphaproteobacteria bacterium]